jgi:predicted acyl esterase
MWVLNPGGLERNKAASEVALQIASPQSTGLASGDWASFGVPGDLPGDQALDSFGSLEFDSTPLEERLEILGQPSVTLDLAVNRPVAIVTVRLIDVAPDGRATLVARGFLNLTQRDSREHPQPVVPGKRYRVKVLLTGTAYAFPAGHKLRVALSTANWPIIWPSPEPVTLTLFAGASQLFCPCGSPNPRTAACGPFRSPKPPQRRQRRSYVRAGSNARSVSTRSPAG